MFAGNITGFPYLDFGQAKAPPVRPDGALLSVAAQSRRCLAELAARRYLLDAGIDHHLVGATALLAVEACRNSDVVQPWDCGKALDRTV